MELGADHNNLNVVMLLDEHNLKYRPFLGTHAVSIPRNVHTWQIKHVGASGWVVQMLHFAGITDQMQGSATMTTNQTDSLNSKEKSQTKRLRSGLVFAEVLMHLVLADCIFVSHRC